MVGRLSSETWCVGKSAHLTLFGAVARKGHKMSCRRRLRSKLTELCCLEKLLSYSIDESVPQTDTGRLVENTKANERTKLEELGKITP